MRYSGFVWRAAVLAIVLIPCLDRSDSLAQGSTGGTIGKKDKSLSGTQLPEPEMSASGSKSRTEARPRPAHAGSALRFDGPWNFVATGCSAGVLPGSISGGSVSVKNGSGQVSASGALRVSFTVYGLATVAVGRLSGANGAGTYSRGDGCKGGWTAAKQ
jgi:hypothetical protein